MALTAITTLDVPGVTQIIKFNDPTQVDEIDFGSNVLTFKAISSYNLSKSDFLLWFNYLDVFNTALILNFPTIVTNINATLPTCQYDFKVGATRITYDQISGSNDVLNLTYLFSNSTMTFAARATDMTMTVNEFFFMVNFLRGVKKQIGFH